MAASKWGKPLKASVLTLWVLFLIGLGSGVVSIQPVMGLEQRPTTPASVLQSSQAAELHASDGTANDGFGWSVAVSGETIVVGATGDDNKGSAYVFVKPSGGWRGVITETAKLIASDGETGDLFGYSVGISDDTIIVAAPSHDGFKGSAYLFLKPSRGWGGTLTESAKLMASDGTSGDSFGTSVALSRDAAIVSADADDIGANEGQGSVNVFVKPGNGWDGTLTETAKLISSDGAANDAFGASARVSGDTIVVGARSNDGSHPGSAYVFIEPNNGWSGTLTETAKLIPSDGASGDFFGVSVGISDDTIVSGAIFHNLDRGAVYTFVKPDSGWGSTLTETAKLVVSDGEGGDRFGVSVAICSDTIVAGSDKDDNKGAAHIFFEPVSGWNATLTETIKLTATNGKTDDLLGGSVAINGASIVVGAVNGNDKKGSAYVFVPNSVYIPIVLK